MSGVLGEKMCSVRLAVESDIDSIYSFDAAARHDSHRRDFVSRSVAAGNCFVAVDDQVIGYAVLEYAFYDHGFVSMLYVHPEHRRLGVGTRLMKHLESVCQTSKLFTSTNLSDILMQSLLVRLGYKLSGVIHNLDEDDPELVYVKFLQ